MDTEEELNQKLRELSNMIRQQSNSMSSINEKLVAAKTNTTQNNAAINANTSAQKNNQTGKTRYHQIVEDTAQKNDKFKENIDKAYGHSIDMLVSFGGALVNSQTGLQKYGQAVESLGKGSAALVENIGLLGKVTGGLLNLFGKFASSILKLNDNTIGIRDNFAKAGGVIPKTTEQLGELAKEAGFSLDNIKTLSEKMTEYSSSMVTLGTTAGEGAVTFMKIANVDDEVRRQFGRMGVSQDHLLELQGLYLESQKVSGAKLLNENKTVEQIQKDSIAYAKTLLKLSSITGKSANELQKEMNAVKLEFEEQQQQLIETREIARLRAEGQGDKADILERERNNRLAMIEAYTAIYGRETAIQMARVFRTGVIDGKTKGLAMLPVEGGIQGSMQRIKESGDIVKTLASESKKIDTAMGQQALLFKDTLEYDSELLEKLGVFSDAVVRLNARPEDIEAAIIDALKKMEEAGEEGRDPRADRYENVRAFERNSKKLWQSLLEFIDPMRIFGSNITTALGIAAAALTGLAVVKLGGGLVSGLFGGLFERGASFTKPNHIVLADLPGGLSSGAGKGTAAFAGSAADPTGLGLRKADLVDKNGKPLGGAALDARLKKLSNERLPKTTSFALKQAAKNSKVILKGAGTLATSIAIVGAGIGAATWLVGLAFPTFAKGMKSFNEVDGANLEKVGIGTAALGAGIYALAAEKVIGFFTGLSSLFGGKSTLENAADQLQKFSEINVDSNKVEKNGKAVLAFANAFKEMPSTTVSISGMIAGFFSGPAMPYAEFEKFDKIEVDPAKAENNSKAFIEFSKAMGSYKNYGTIGGLGTIVSAIADSVLKYYEVGPPEKRFKDFSDLEIEAEKAGNSAIAFKDFAEGMRKYKGSPENISILSSLIGTKINMIFGADGPIEAFVQFSKDTKDIGDHAAKNARAFFNFARALRMLTGDSFMSSVIKSGSDIISGLFGSRSGAGSSADSSTSAATSGPVTPGPDGKVLDLIGKVESGNNYNKLVGGKIEPKLTSMTIQEVLDFQSGMKRRGHESTAVGKYQIINQTLAGRVSAGVVSRNDKFDPSNQDKLAISLKNFRGREKFRQGKLSVDNYADNLSKEWASLPFRTGRSFYDKVGSNKSLISRNELINSLKAKEGGLFSGPTSGYPIELHGTELIVPIDTNSVLMKLATEPAAAKSESVNQSTNPTKTVNSVTKKITQKSIIDPARIESIGDFLDKIIDVIETTDDIDQKILRYS
jgi:muramidase (phage lysozyme)